MYCYITVILLTFLTSIEPRRSIKYALTIILYALHLERSSEKKEKSKQK